VIQSNRVWLTTVLATVSLPILAASVDVAKLPPSADKKGLTYADDIRPIFETSCIRCHGMEKTKAGLRLDSLEGVLKGSKDGKVIQPGKSEKSQLVIAVARLDEESAMPPKPRPGRARGAPGGGPNPPGGAPLPKPLTAEQVGLIRAWIDQGAK
jgi:hypothetical protein